MAHNSRVANYGNTDDSAYNYDGAYYSYTGDDYLGNNHGTYEDSTPDHYYPDTQVSYNSALGQYATEQGLTARELQELEDECTRDQETFEREYQEEMRDRQGVQGEAIGRIEETEELEYEQQEGLADETQASTSLPVYNHEQEPPSDWAEDRAEVLACMYTRTTYHHEPRGRRGTKGIRARRTSSPTSPCHSRAARRMARCRRDTA